MAAEGSLERVAPTWRPEPSGWARASTCSPGCPTCMVMVGVVSPPAAVSVVCAADTVMAVGLITWLERVAMVPKVVMGVAREALVLWPPAPARLVDTVPVTVPRVVTPEGREGGGSGMWEEARCWHRLPGSFSPWAGGAGAHPDSAPLPPRPTHLLCPSRPTW